MKTNFSQENASEKLRKNLIFNGIIGIGFLLFLTYLLPASFYPVLASSRGIGQGLIGLMLSFYALGAIITSVAIGKFLIIWGKRTSFALCCFSTVLFTLLFGIIELIENPSIFYIFSVICRFFQGGGMGGGITVLMAYIPVLFPDDIQSKAGLLEVSAGLGSAGGIVIGGFLQYFLGYQLVFYICSFVILVSGLLCLKYFPCDKEIREENCIEEKTDEIQYSRILKNPRFITTCLVEIYGNIIITGFFGITVTHSKSLGMSDLLICFSNFLVVFVYTLANIYLSIKTFKFDRRLLILIGFGFYIPYYIFAGPQDFLAIQNPIPVAMLSFLSAAIGVACCYIPIYPELMEISRIEFEGSGIRNLNEKLGNIISGIIMALVTLGEFLGPIFSGFMIENFGINYLQISYLILNYVLFSLYMYFGKGYEMFLAIEKQNENKETIITHIELKDNN